MKSRRVVKPSVLYMNEHGSDIAKSALNTIHKNYQNQLCELDKDETKNITIAAMGAGIGGIFGHTSKLKVMKFKAAINGPHSNTWKEEIENEYTKMMMNSVWESLDKEDLPEEVKVIISTWACKKKVTVPTVVD